MMRAVQISLKGKGKTSPDPLAGALLVKGTKIIAERWRKTYDDPYVFELLRAAGPLSENAVLYMTMEPRHHYEDGVQETDMIVRGGIKSVVIGLKDPHPLYYGKGVTALRQLGIGVKTGILKGPVESSNAPYITYIREKRPYLTAKSAQTIDGKIATAGGHSQWITSEESRRFARKARGDFDAIMVGINTVLKDDPRLDPVPLKKKFLKIVVDSHLKIPPRAKVLKDPWRCLVATTKQADRKKVERLRKNGVKVVICPSKDKQVRLQWLFEELGKNEVVSVLLEGGGRLAGGAFKERLVDRVHIYIAPKIAGDARALNAVDGLHPRTIDDIIKLNHLNVTAQGPDLLVQADVAYL